MLLETTYYIYQNIHIGSIKETKENYEYVMKICIERKYAHTHEEKKDELFEINETHDTFYDEDGNIICCLSKFEEKGETK